MRRRAPPRPGVAGSRDFLTRSGARRRGGHSSHGKVGCEARGVLNPGASCTYPGYTAYGEYTGAQLPATPARLRSTSRRVIARCASLLLQKGRAG